jgi:8-oxo-dGTP pyrophosphatase MutT (NUDIX family)
VKIDLRNLSAVEEFLRDRLRQTLPGAQAHRRFAPRPAREGWRPDDIPSRARRAAALILLYPGEHGITIPLTVRHTDLPHHPGQVSLPGGRIDLDESAAQAALRETHEEIGVAPGQVDILGALSTLWVHVSNHVIQPFVGVAHETPAFVLAAREVEELVPLPLVDLHDLTRIGWEPRMRNEAVVDVPFFQIHRHRVWGATAMILGEFGSLFQEDFGPLL